MERRDDQVSLAATFDDWTLGRKVPFLSTNAGAGLLPFQDWRRFKEAFTPEIVYRAVHESAIPVSTCLDPFGGSGTTALCAQFLGIHPITAEVNPFLADLIEAKLASYNSDRLASDLGAVIRRATEIRLTSRTFSYLPKTFVQPGIDDRWLFNRDVAKEIFRIRCAIETLTDDTNRRFFQVLLGGVLVNCSNALTSGKGRRYRKNWEKRPVEPRDVSTAFVTAAQNAMSEIYRFRNRGVTSYDVVRGDARNTLDHIYDVDLAIFSPPYPNSFDYTDVYNIELWMLGYLSNREENATLRGATLSSHVQLIRKYSPAPKSDILAHVLQRLTDRRLSLWSRWIPDMVGAYFADILTVMNAVHRALRPRGRAWVIVGDSKYSDVLIPTADILIDLASARWQVITREPFRSMRSSPQQGGERNLEETLVVLEPLA